MRKIILSIFFITFVSRVFFGLTIIKDLEKDYFPKLTKDQRDVIIGYGILLSDTARTMDDFTQSEQYELLALLDWNDVDYNECIIELKDVVKIGNYNPVSIYLRYSIIDEFKVKLDIAKLDDLVKLFFKKNTSAVKVRSTLFSILYNFCSEVNPKSQFKIPFNTLYTLISKLYYSDDIFRTLQVILQDDTAKKYILYGSSTKSGSYNSKDLQLIYDNLKKKFTTIDESKTKKMIQVMLEQGRGRDKVYSEIYGIFATFCKGLNAGSSYKSLEVSFDSIYKLVVRLANSPSLGNSILIVLNDKAVKDYFIK